MTATPKAPRDTGDVDLAFGAEAHLHAVRQLAEQDCHLGRADRAGIVHELLGLWQIRRARRGTVDDEPGERAVGISLDALKELAQHAQAAWLARLVDRGRH